MELSPYNLQTVVSTRLSEDNARLALAAMDELARRGATLSCVDGFTQGALIDLLGQSPHAREVLIGDLQFDRPEELGTVLGISELAFAYAARPQTYGRGWQHLLRLMARQCQRHFHSDFALAVFAIDQSIGRLPLKFSLCSAVALEDAACQTRGAWHMDELNYLRSANIWHALNLLLDMLGIGESLWPEQSPVAAVQAGEPLLGL